MEKQRFPKGNEHWVMIAWTGLAVALFASADCILDGIAGLGWATLLIVCAVAFIRINDNSTQEYDNGFADGVKTYRKVSKIK